MKRGTATVFFLLCLAFLAFSISIYIKPADLKNKPPFADADKATKGRLVWQAYNCQSCHQLYGLGGYLGPDLTNVYSAHGKGEILIRAMIIAGTSTMPAFDLSENEQDQLIAFLRQTDASGSADPRNFTILNNGMIRQK